MHTVKLYNKIDPEGLKRLPADFSLTEGDDYDGVILRSYKMGDAEAVPSLVGVARAGAGYNNIPVNDYAAKGIVVFNTPGANANAVKELVVLGALLASRKVFDGITWAMGLTADVEVETEVENQKALYTGPEIMGKAVGVIGLGAVGVRVANIFEQLGASVFGYDPSISIDNAWRLRSDISRVSDLGWIFENCDYVTLHVPYLPETKELVNRMMLTRAKDGIRILNFARGELVDDAAMIEALNSGKVAAYVTDFPNKRLVGIPNVYLVPHLGASTPEAETNCAIMAADQLAEYLTTGNIVNSVNYPDCTMGPLTDGVRITINHLNVPNMVGQITTLLASENINIANMINKSRGEYAYTMLDIDSDVIGETIEKLQEVQGILKVRRLTAEA